MNFFIIVNIISTCKETVHMTSLCFSIQKKAFLFSFSLARNRYTWSLVCKKGLLICFESYQGILYSHTGKVDINPICKR